MAFGGCLAAATPANAWTVVPSTAAQNTWHDGIFQWGANICYFSFMFGNFGVGYTQLDLNSAGCHSAVTGVISAKNGSFYSDYAYPEAPYSWDQATAPAGNILEAQFCISTGNGAVLFQYNALTNTLKPITELANFECY